MRRRGLPIASLLGFLLSAAAAHATPPEQGPIDLRVVAPRRYYRPGESITLELRCDAGLTDEVIVFFNPGAADEGGADHPAQKCPRSRFNLVVPKDFVGPTSAAVLLEQSGLLYGDRVWLEVRSDAKPRQLWMRDLWSSEESPLGEDACRPLSFYPGHSVPEPLHFHAVLTDGIRMDLCGDRDATFRTEPASDFPFAIRNGSCTVTPRRVGSFRLTASFRGLTKSWVCTVRKADLPPPTRNEPQRGNPTPMPPAPARAPLTTAEFLANPTKLDGHPTDVGNCRLLEHWTTGYCYVYSLRQGKKVSQETDVRCEELGELRQRMKTAIETGHCQ